MIGIKTKHKKASLFGLRNAKRSETFKSFSRITKDMALTNQQYKKIERFTLNYYKGLDFVHNVSHAKRTVKIALAIAKKEGGNKKMIRLGALLHQFHDYDHILERYLRKLKLSKEDRDILMHFPYFRAHRGRKPKFLEAQIVYDADALQVLAPFGTFRLFSLGVIKHKDMNNAVQRVKKVQARHFRALQTKTAKKMAKEPQKLSNKFLKLFEQEDKGKY